jgi:hypothetical protein
MNEIIRVVPLMAIYNQFEGPTPPQYSNYQPAGDGLQFREGVVRDDVGVRWFTKKTENPGAVKYIKRSMTNLFMPDFYYPHVRARGDANYGFLGVIDPQDVQTEKERVHVGEAESVTVNSIMVFCRPPLHGHDLYSLGKEEFDRTREHEKPMRRNGSLVVGPDGVLSPLCPDGPQEDDSKLYTRFLRVSSLLIKSEGTVIFEPPAKAGAIEEAIEKLQRELDASIEQFKQQQKKQFKDYKEQLEKKRADTDKDSKPKLYGRALRRAGRLGPPHR